MQVANLHSCIFTPLIVQGNLARWSFEMNLDCVNMSTPLKRIEVTKETTTVPEIFINDLEQKILPFEQNPHRKLLSL